MQSPVKYSQRHAPSCLTLYYTVHNVANDHSLTCWPLPWTLGVTGWSRRPCFATDQCVVCGVPWRRGSLHPERSRYRLPARLWSARYAAHRRPPAWKEKTDWADLNNKKELLLQRQSVTSIPNVISKLSLRKASALSRCFDYFVPNEVVSWISIYWAA